jgi:predicted DNA-binding ArsR family transcriptional regulator
MTEHPKPIDSHSQFSLAKKNPPMTEVTNKLNIDPSLLSSVVQLTDKMKVDLQQVTSRLNALEQKVKRVATSS